MICTICITWLCYISGFFISIYLTKGNNLVENNENDNTQIYLTKFYYSLSRMWMITMLRSDREQNNTLIKGNEAFDICMLVLVTT